MKMLDMRRNSFRLSGTTVARVLCDRTSINSTFSSNHTLFAWGVESGQLDDPDDLDVVFEMESSFGMNRDKNKSAVARKKFLKHHFPGGGGAKAFLIMPETAMPNAIECIGRDRHGYSLMYDLARELPTLFDNRRELHEEGKKRKRTYFQSKG